MRCVCPAALQQLRQDALGCAADQMGGVHLVIEGLTSVQALVHSQGLSACCTPDPIASRGGQAEGIKA